MDSTIKQARRMNAPRAIALCLCFIGALEFQAGRWDEAETALRESINLYRSIGAASGEALASQRLGILLTARRRFDEALEVLHEGIAAAERALMRAHCLTRLYAAITRNRLEAGDLDAAEAALSLGLSMRALHGNCSTCSALLLPTAVSVRVVQNELIDAERFCNRLDEAAEEYGSRTWKAMAHQARGALAAARGEVDTAVERYAVACSDFHAANYDYEAAQCKMAMAALYRRKNNERKAQAVQDEAEQIFIQLGGIV